MCFRLIIDEMEQLREDNKRVDNSSCLSPPLLSLSRAPHTPDCSLQTQSPQSRDQTSTVRSIDCGRLDTSSELTEVEGMDSLPPSPALLLSPYSSPRTGQDVRVGLNLSVDPCSAPTNTPTNARGSSLFFPLI